MAPDFAACCQQDEGWTQDCHYSPRGKKLWWPCCPAEAMPLTAQKGPRLQPGSPTTPVATILVVDDDALITLNMADLVAEMGHVAIEAYSPHEALGHLESGASIAALVTDYSMPGMSGVDLAEAARALRPGLPVLLISGYAELPDGVLCNLTRLEKPFREADFIREVTALLEPQGK